MAARYHGRHPRDSAQKFSGLCGSVGRMMMHWWNVVVFLLLITGSALAAEVSFSDLGKPGKKLPYGKSIVISGEVKQVPCNGKPLNQVMMPSSVHVSYLGQRDAPGPGVVQNGRWSAPLGILPPDTTVQIRVRFTGELKSSKEIIDTLIDDPIFQNYLGRFFLVTKEQGGLVVQEEAAHLLRNISDPDGPLPAALRAHAPCLAVNEITSRIAARLASSLPALANIQVRMDNVLKHNLDDAPDGMSELFQFTQKLEANAYKKDDKNLPKDKLKAAKNSVSLFQEDYAKLREAFVQTVAVEVANTALMERTVDTTDLEKYAGFDVGAVYVPRVDELRHFFTINIHPFGPVELDTQGLLTGGWRNRFSITFGVSMGDFSGKESSRIKSDNAFVYGVGWRINKYFRLSAGAMLFREASTRNALLHEAFVGSSVDITALPGLRQIFARAATR